MSKTSCALCNEPVLRSKGNASSATLNWRTGEKGYWWAHNDCLQLFYERQLMHRLLDACDGDGVQAERVRDAITHLKARPR